MPLSVALHARDGDGSARRRDQSRGQARVALDATRTAATVVEDAAEGNRTALAEEDTRFRATLDAMRSDAISPKCGFAGEQCDRSRTRLTTHQGFGDDTGGRRRILAHEIGRVRGASLFG